MGLFNRFNHEAYVPFISHNKAYKRGVDTIQFCTNFDKKVGGFIIIMSQPKNHAFLYMEYNRKYDTLFKIGHYGFISNNNGEAKHEVSSDGKLLTIKWDIPDNYPLDTFNVFMTVIVNNTLVREGKSIKIINNDEQARKEENINKILKAQEAWKLEEGKSINRVNTV